MGEEETLFFIAECQNEIHFHWEKKKNCLLLFTMHPPNLDHKDMQRRGVQTFQAGEIVGVKGHRMNQGAFLWFSSTAFSITQT